MQSICNKPPIEGIYTIISINQSINQFISHHSTCVLQCGYAESKRNVLRWILNVLTDGAVRQFRGREFKSLGAATEKRRAAVSMLCGGTDRNFCVDDRSKRDWVRVIGLYQQRWNPHLIIIIIIIRKYAMRTSAHGWIWGEMYGRLYSAGGYVYTLYPSCKNSLIMYGLNHWQ